MLHSAPSRQGVLWAHMGVRANANPSALHCRCLPTYGSLKLLFDCFVVWQVTAKVADFGLALPLDPSDTHATLAARVSDRLNRTAAN